MDHVIIDGIRINAQHFGKMTKAEAVKRMIADGFVPGADKKEKEEWASHAYSLIVKQGIKEKGADQ